MEDFNTGLDFDIDDIRQEISNNNTLEAAKSKAKIDKLTKTKEKIEKTPTVTQDDLNELLGVPNVTKPKKSARPKKPDEERDTNKLVDPDKNLSQKKQDELHQNLLMVAQRFLNNERYKDYLKANGFKPTDKLEKKTLKDLESYVNRMRYCASNKKSGQIANNSIQGIFKLLETGVTNNSKGRINLTGFADALFNNEDFLDDLELFKIEYLSFVNVRYELRLVITMVQTAFLVHTVNTKPFAMKFKAAQQPLDQTVPQPQQPQPHQPPPQKNVSDADPAHNNADNKPSQNNVAPKLPKREDNLHDDHPVDLSKLDKTKKSTLKKPAIKLKSANPEVDFPSADDIDKLFD